MLSIWASKKFCRLVRVDSHPTMISDPFTITLTLPASFVAFFEDNATMNSITYFENHVSYFVQNRRK